MTKAELLYEIRKYLAKGSESDRKRKIKQDEKAKFVGRVRDLLQAPEVRAVLKQTNTALDILTLSLGMYSSGKTSYRLSARHDGLYQELNEEPSGNCAMEAQLERWMKIIPYGSCFAYYDEPWKPDTAQYINGLEDQIRKLLR